jgi:hypothetical protein
MSENSMMMGYSVLVEKDVSDERSDDLIENFDSSLIKKWQPFYDEDGDEYLIYLTDYESMFYDDISTSVNIKQMLEASQTLHQYLEEEMITEYATDAIDIHFFVKVWYNGSDMGSIINSGDE